ncbi:hypothetical protein [Rhizobium herbae]|uniref:Uncharacterized protein n=1 Tax=Rhizobium herbae TaxID=508661 RepID=A0ABS4ELM5_9HYPH|nr:hypothetical protein [Rhizobium herbae]MBP1858847.1 hypothetical protein [Rhizobium herbae]
MGSIPISKFSGFKDEVGEKVIAIAFAIGMLGPDHVEKQRKKLTTIEEAPVQPPL